MEKKGHAQVVMAYLPVDLLLGFIGGWVGTVHPLREGEGVWQCSC